MSHKNILKVQHFVAYILHHSLITLAERLLRFNY